MKLPRFLAAAALALLAQCSPILALPPPTQSVTIDASGNVQQTSLVLPNGSSLTVASGATVDLSAGTITLPALGVATATSINGVTITGGTNTFTVTVGTASITVPAALSGTIGTAAFTTSAARQLFANDTARLGQSGPLAVGTRNIVTFDGAGFAEWEYLGGTISTPSNWRLVGDITLFRSSTASSTNNTLADDAVFKVGYLPVGTYTVSVWIDCYGPAGGFAFDFASSGTLASSNKAQNVGGVDGVSISSFTNLATGTSYSAITVEALMKISGNITVTVAGDFRFQWAQATTNATASQIYAGSAMFIHPATP